MATDDIIPKEVEDEVRSQLEPLFLDFYTGSKLFKAYYGYIEKLGERTLRATNFLRIVRLANEAKTLEPKTETVLDALLYLTQIELIGTGYVDMAILLLIAKGLDLHLEPDDKHRYTRHVTSPEDLASPSLTLSVKLDFLKLNGLPFFAKCIDRNLRNRIAHADFEVDDDGKFFQFTKRGKKEVDVADTFFRFALYMRSVEIVLREQIAKVTAPK